MATGGLSPSEHLPWQDGEESLKQLLLALRHSVSLMLRGGLRDEDVVNNTLGKLVLLELTEVNFHRYRVVTSLKRRIQVNFGAFIEETVAGQLRTMGAGGGSVKSVAAWPGYASFEDEVLEEVGEAVRSILQQLGAVVPGDPIWTVLAAARSPAAAAARGGVVRGAGAGGAEEGQRGGRTSSGGGGGGVGAGGAGTAAGAEVMSRTRGGGRRGGEGGGGDGSSSDESDDGGGGGDEALELGGDGGDGGDGGGGGGGDDDDLDDGTEDGVLWTRPPSGGDADGDGGGAATWSSHSVNSVSASDQSGFGDGFSSTDPFCFDLDVLPPYERVVPIMRDLRGDRELEVRQGAMDSLLEFSPGDLMANENWKELRVCLVATLGDRDAGLRRACLSLHWRLFCEASMSSSVQSGEIYLNLLAHLFAHLKERHHLTAGAKGAYQFVRSHDGGGRREQGEGERERGTLLYSAAGTEGTEGVKGMVKGMVGTDTLNTPAVSSLLTLLRFMREMQVTLPRHWTHLPDLISDQVLVSTFLLLRRIRFPAVVGASSAMGGGPSSPPRLLQPFQLHSLVDSEGEWFGYWMVQARPRAQLVSHLRHSGLLRDLVWRCWRYQYWIDRHNSGDGRKEAGKAGDRGEEE